jgi:hypothetical protein
MMPSKENVPYQKRCRTAFPGSKLQWPDLNAIGIATQSAFSIKPACGAPKRKGAAGYSMRPKWALVRRLDARLFA